MAKFRSLCVAGVIALSGAMATAMQAQTVSRNFNSQPLKSVLHEIERQTKMSVIVNDINLNKRVTANFNKTPLRDVLKQVLDESCEYEIADRIITIHPSRKAKQEAQQQGKNLCEFFHCALLLRIYIYLKPGFAPPPEAQLPVRALQGAPEPLRGLAALNPDP